VARTVELVDNESGETLRLAPDDEVFGRYAAAVGEWLVALESVCAAEQSAYARVSSSWGIDDLLLTLLHERGVVA